ncbi:MAG: hypothetical protein M3Y73_06090 [Actinomycetota bacterium]|nr:hypothetical protein [Actinomycetota bacterium]
MIGVIGPHDSVNQVLRIARTQGIDDHVMGRCYEHLHEALALTDEADRHCQVILFTGAFPYALVCAHLQPLADLQYISHGGVDFHKNLLEISLQPGFTGLPPMSFDTADRLELDRALEDLTPSLTPPLRVIELDTSDPDAAEKILCAQHHELYKAGEVKLCLTSSRGTYELLREAKVPARRITHAAVEVARSLERAELQRSLRLAQDTRPCIALAETLPSRPDASASASWNRLGALPGARVLPAEDADHIHLRLTHGAARRWLHAHPADHPTHFGLGSAPDDKQATEHAREALKHSQRLQACVLLSPEGMLTSAGHAETRPRADSTLATTAHELGITPESLKRLSAVLLNQPSHEVTARELAAAYRVTARTARKLLTTLAQAGYATKVGQAGHPSAGRPQTVYRIDYANLNP